MWWTIVFRNNCGDHVFPIGTQLILFIVQYTVFISIVLSRASIGFKADKRVENIMFWKHILRTRMKGMEWKEFNWKDSSRSKGNRQVWVKVNVTYIMWHSNANRLLSDIHRIIHFEMLDAPCATLTALAHRNTIYK